MLKGVLNVIKVNQSGARMGTRNHTCSPQRDNGHPTTNVKTGHRNEMTKMILTIERSSERSVSIFLIKR